LLHKFVFFLALMVGLGSVQRAKAQSIMGATQVQQNSIHYYTTDYFCDLMLYTINWGVSGGIILQNQGINGVLIKWTSTAGQVFMTANSACCNEYNPCSASLDVGIQPTTITISGRVANPCGTGIQGVALQGFPTSVTTDGNGYYSVTVPYGWTGVVSASLSPFSFSPSQSSVNTTANRTLNFTVNAGSLTGASLSVTRGFSPAFGQTITIGGMIPGYSYVYYYTYTTGGSGSGEFTPATRSTEVNQISNVSSFCVRLSCGSVPVCVN
jgi:hypothetical protein